MVLVSDFFCTFATSMMRVVGKGEFYHHLAFDK